MAFSPIAFVAPNYRDYKNNWLKAYEPGTTTPKTMALDSTGSVLAIKVEINKDGFIESAGGALVIPYIDGAYDLWIFPNEADADANDTSGALRVADNITSGVSGENALTFVQDEQEISAGQLIVDFDGISVSRAKIYIGKGGGDRGRLFEGADDDYTITGGNQITLTESFNANTKLIAESSELVDKIESIKPMTLAEAVSNLTAFDGQIVQITDRADAQFTYLTGQTPNTFNIVSADDATLDLVLRTNDVFNALQWGLVGGDGSTDDSAAFVHIVNAANGSPVFMPSSNTYFLEDINTANNQTPTFTAALNLYSDDKETCVIKGSADRTQNLRLKQVSDYVSFRNITFDSWQSCAYMPASASPSSYSIGAVYADNCTFKNLGEAAMTLAHNGPIQSVQITNCIFEDILGHTGNPITSGLWIGSEAFGNHENQENFIITNNIFRRITTVDGGVDCHGVILWGESMVISNNTFDTIHNADFDFGSEAIYTKSKFAIIDSNVLKNAGYNESAINLKGTIRGAGVTNEGHSNIISNNIITWDSDDTHDKRGIYVRTDDLLIIGNVIDGADFAIWSGTEELSDLDVTIKSNTIRNLRGQNGISIRNYGDSTYIIGNIIESITYGGSDVVKLIAIENETQINNAIIEDNIIIVNDRCTATGEIRCINISPSASMTQLTVRNNSIYFTNQTALPIGINLTGIVNIGRADIFNNLIPGLGTTGILDYKNWLNLTSLPDKFNFFNNGFGIEGCNIANEKQKYFKTYTYDFTVDDLGTINIGELPTGATVTNATLSCKATFTNASGTSTVSVGITTDDVTGIFADADISTAPFTVGAITQGIPDNIVANYTNTTTDIRTVRLVVSGQALTAGVMEITLEYIIA